MRACTEVQRIGDVAVIGPRASRPAHIVPSARNMRRTWRSAVYLLFWEALRLLLYRFALATAAFSRRLAPGTDRASSIASFTLWLMPSKQGVKIIAVGAIVATA